MINVIMKVCNRFRSPKGKFGLPERPQKGESAADLEGTPGRVHEPGKAQRITEREGYRAEAENKAGE